METYRFPGSGSLALFIDRLSETKMILGHVVEVGPHGRELSCLCEN